MKIVFSFLFCLFTTGLFAQEARNLTQAIQYVKLANTLRELDKSPAAIDLLERALPAVQSKNLYWTAIANELLGLCYKDQTDSAQALNYLRQARSQYAQLKYVASAWAVNEIIRDLSGKNLYAGVQIGSTDIRVAILKTDYETDFYEKDVQKTFVIPNSLLVADASSSFKTGQTALRTSLDSLLQYSIPTERIFIAFTSDVDKSLTPAEKKRLYNELVQSLPNKALTIDTTLTDKREAELFTIGAIPRKVWPSTSSLSLGNTSTIGGYFDDKQSFHGINVPIGLQTLVNRIDPRGTLRTDAFKREAEQLVQTLVDSAMSPQLTANKAGLGKRNTIGLSGDIALALTTYLHPDRAGIKAVPITMEDAEQFKQLALNHYQRLTRPDLGLITDPTQRSEAEEALGSVQSQLNEKQIIAGALWLEAVMKAYNKLATRTRFVFIKNADIGWVAGKFLETINGEYESTIAKGALYTR
ncbi:tetratricopeptide repeat protein [Spirosoma sp. KUDC1026]|uniref:tetratricopeptide repeat protein n=1 Tax=Spirosoma sp. KUDC1026 TaxID=2745947 RepID=UPI00159BE083|nr:tetratricopeptide repeat protein [Spirosoma sp. KUDC1026]QKZ14028.1 tetratricopeptide repeat protein [Spirosoma sp. KUDC1026]